MLFWYIIFIVCFTEMHLLVNEKDLVSVSVIETILAPGEKVVVVIRVKVSTGYHIQADKVTNESLIPVSLATGSNKYFLINKPVFPAFKLFRLEGSEEMLNVFDSIFTIRLPVEALTTAKVGRYVVKAQISYQACTATICLFPRKIDFDLPIIVKKQKNMMNRLMRSPQESQKK